jgi:hypothetical protein
LHGETPARKAEKPRFYLSGGGFRGVCGVDRDRRGVRIGKLGGRLLHDRAVTG